MTLLEPAGLTRIGLGQPLPPIADQCRALRTAGREIELEEGVALTSFLCTYLPALPELMAKIAPTLPERFRRSHRPHGLLVTMAAEAAMGQIRRLRGDAIPVRGEIAILGERDGHGQEVAGDRRVRSRYLAVCHGAGGARPAGRSAQGLPAFLSEATETLHYVDKRQSVFLSHPAPAMGWPRVTAIQ